MEKIQTTIWKDKNWDLEIHESYIQSNTKIKDVYLEKTEFLELYNADKEIRNDRIQAILNKSEK
jgi:hypothetical protein